MNALAVLTHTSIVTVFESTWSHRTHFCLDLGCVELVGFDLLFSNSVLLHETANFLSAYGIYDLSIL
jgi:hypothetical protein